MTRRQPQIPPSPPPTPYANLLFPRLVTPPLNFSPLPPALLPRASIMMTPLYYIYMYIYIYVCIYITCVCVCVRPRTSITIPPLYYIYMYINICICIYITCVCVCVHEPPTRYPHSTSSTSAAYFRNHTYTHAPQPHAHIRNFHAPCPLSQALTRAGSNCSTHRYSPRTDSSPLQQRSCLQFLPAPATFSIFFRIVQVNPLSFCLFFFPYAIRPFLWKKLQKMRRVLEKRKSGILSRKTRAF